MGTRRGSRRRRRRPPTDAAPAPANTPAQATRPTAGGGGRYGKAALALALLIGMLIEQIAADVLPTEALDIFHVAIVVGIAFFVARWYRGFMRRTLSRRREARR